MELFLVHCHSFRLAVDVRWVRRVEHMERVPQESRFLLPRADHPFAVIMHNRTVLPVSGYIRTVEYTRPLHPLCGFLRGCLGMNRFSGFALIDESVYTVISEDFLHNKEST